MGAHGVELVKGCIDHPRSDTTLKRTHRNRRAMDATPGLDDTPAPALDALDQHPPSARQVYSTLSQQGPLTHKDLLRATGMPGRTVRYAVNRLKEAGIIGARCNLQDCRQCFFYVQNVCPGKPGYERSNVIFAGIREVRLT